MYSSVKNGSCFFKSHTSFKNKIQRKRKIRGGLDFIIFFRLVLRIQENIKPKTGSVLMSKVAETEGLPQADEFLDIGSI